MIIKDALQKANSTLLDSQIARDFENLGLDFRAGFEAQVLLAHILKKKRPFLHTHDFQNLDSEKEVAFFELIKRRANGEPLEYLTHCVSFYSREFFIDFGALIPRADSEILIDCVLEILRNFEFERVAEIGVGSGALSCTLALEFQNLKSQNPNFENLKIIASDISESALKIAAKNVEKFALDSEISLLKSDLLSHFHNLNSQNLPQLIFSNPPYIKNDFALPLSVSFEPHTALFGGENGDEILQNLISQCAKLGVQFLVCEIGFDQAQNIENFVRNFEHKSLKFVKDLSGVQRVFVLRFY